MNNCLYRCMHCVMMFCNKAGAGPCSCMQPQGPCCIEIGKKRKKIPAMDFVAYYSWHALLKRWSKWAGADNLERDRSPWLWFMAVWVGVQTIVESVRSFPGWYCSTVWTTVSSRQGLVVEFGIWAFPLLRFLLPFLPLCLCQHLPLLFLLILGSFVQSRVFVMKSVCIPVFQLFQLYPGACSVLAPCYCYLFSCLCVCDQTAMTHCPPLPSLCTPGFVSPFTL